MFQEPENENSLKENKTRLKGQQMTNTQYKEM